MPQGSLLAPSPPQSPARHAIASNHAWAGIIDTLREELTSTNDSIEKARKLLYSASLPLQPLSTDGKTAPSSGINISAVRKSYPAAAPLAAASLESEALLLIFMLKERLAELHRLELALARSEMCNVALAAAAREAVKAAGAREISKLGIPTLKVKCSVQPQSWSWWAGL